MHGHSSSCSKIRPRLTEIIGSPQLTNKRSGSSSMGASWKIAGPRSGAAVAVVACTGRNCVECRLRLFFFSASPIVKVYWNIYYIHTAWSKYVWHTTKPRKPSLCLFPSLRSFSQTFFLSFLSFFSFARYFVGYYFYVEAAFVSKIRFELIGYVDGVHTIWGMSGSFKRLYCFSESRRVVWLVRFFGKDNALFL